MNTQDKIKQSENFSKTMQPVFHRVSDLQDVRIQYKQGRQNVSNTFTSSVKHAERTGFRPIVQRRIVVVTHEKSMDDASSICDKCLEKGLEKTALRYGINMDKMDLLNGFR